MEGYPTSNMKTDELLLKQLKKEEGLKKSRTDMIASETAAESVCVAASTLERGRYHPDAGKLGRGEEKVLGECNFLETYLFHLLR